MFLIKTNTLIAKEYSFIIVLGTGGVFLRMIRIDKENYYLDISQTVLERGTCLRRNFGAIIVNNNQIIFSGYAALLNSGICKRIPSKINF